MIIFFKPELKIVDPICTFIFAVLVVFTTIPVLKDCMIVIMEGTPVGIVIHEFEDELKEVEGIVEIHDLHIWSLSVGKPALSAHIVSNNPGVTLREGTKLCRRYGIYHSTLQIEDHNDRHNPSFIKCKQNIHASMRVVQEENATQNN